MGQNNPIYKSFKTNQRGLVCNVCKRQYTISEPGLIVIQTKEAPEARKISFCYHHVLEMVVKNDSYLPAISVRGKHFHLESFLKETEEILKTRNPSGRKTQRTIKLLKRFLEQTGLTGHVLDPTCQAGSEYLSRSV